MRRDRGAPVLPVAALGQLDSSLDLTQPAVCSMLELTQAAVCDVSGDVGGFDFGVCANCGGVQ